MDYNDINHWTYIIKIYKGKACNIHLRSTFASITFWPPLLGTTRKTKVFSLAFALGLLLPFLTTFGFLAWFNHKFDDDGLAIKPYVNSAHWVHNANEGVRLGVGYMMSWKDLPKINHMHVLVCEITLFFGKLCEITLGVWYSGYYLFPTLSFLSCCCPLIFVLNLGPIMGELCCLGYCAPAFDSLTVLAIQTVLSCRMLNLAS